jgi:hypothetical protein
MFGTISASSARGAGFTRRRTRALAGIALWLWSSWVIAAGCCCEPVDLAAASVAPHAPSASPADEHGHDHGHGHPLPPVPGGLDGSHSQDNVPVDDCSEIKAPTHGVVPKEAAPPSLLALDHLALVPAQLADPADPWGDARNDWPLPAPPTPPGDSSLETVRLLL